MAYRELHVVEIREILRLWVRGRGLRTIAERTSVDRKTVRRYIEAARAFGLSREPDSVELNDELVANVVATVRPGAPRDHGAMREHCRAHAAKISEWVEAGCRGPKVVKLLARHTRVAVPLRTMQRFINEDLDRSRRDTDTVRISESPTGVLEIDFLTLGPMHDRGSGQTRTLHALLCTAAHSRHQFVWPCFSQTQQDVIDGLEAAWRFFGGVFPVVISDNLKAVVTVPDPMKPTFNASFVEYMQSRDFEVDPARPRKPKDKARVERQVRYVRDDYFRGEDFPTLVAAREEAERWSRDDAGMRTHGTTRRHPREVFEETDRLALNGLPSEPYDAPVWSNVTVGRDHAVVVGYALYSVPYDVSPGELRACQDAKTVKLYRKAQLVKTHPRRGPGESHIDPADLPPGKAELVARDGQSLQQRAEGYGDAVGEYTRRLLDGPLPWSRMRHVYRLLGLAQRYGGALTDEACRRALELDVVDVMRIDRMLENGLVTAGQLQRPTPKPPRTDNVIRLRFARDPDEYRTRRPNEGDLPDASA